MAERVVADRYRLERRLATGGMGEVWAARDLELDRQVALKLLGPEADPARFEREAHAAASLSHPNVTQLFDYGEWEGRPYMVLELVPGGTLEDRLRDARPLPDDETERIAYEVQEPLELVAMHRNVPAPPVASLRPDAPPQLAHLADAALAKDPHARPPDGSALVAALGGVPATAEAATAVRAPPGAVCRRRGRARCGADRPRLLLAVHHDGLERPPQDHPLHDDALDLDA